MPEDAAAAAGPGRTVHQAFEEQVRRTPNAPAVRCGPEELSYAELDARANRLARFLRAQGLPPFRLVAVSMGRTPDLLVAMLAVLKAGCAYVPVEPTAPDALIRHVLSTARPSAVLSHEGHRVRLSDIAARPVHCLDTEAARIAEYSAEPFDSGAGPHDLACVFFTSGSTGEPKGALVEHGNLLSAYRGWQEVFGFTAADRHLQSTTFEFDVFTADWVRALCSGGLLVMAQRNFTLDRSAGIAELHALILAERITVIGSSVLMARLLSAYLRSTGARLGEVRLMLIGADKWYLDEQARLQEQVGSGVRVANIYGVAEAGIDCAYFEVSMLEGAPARHPRQLSLIGRPFPGLDLGVFSVVTDASVREPGELRIGGPAVGRGYLDDPLLTKARFPFARFGSQAAVRAYRTRDVGRLRSDGLLEYIGRLDERQAVSYTSELARIEGFVRENSQVDQCVVADIEVPGAAPARVAYVVASDPALPLDTFSLRSIVNAQLASGYVDAVVPLTSLPRTRAGKIDRRNLPLPAPRQWADPGSRGGRPGSVTVWPGGSLKGGGPAGGTVAGSRRRWFGVTVLFSLLALLLTTPLWPSSTDLTFVPGAWHAGFRLLYGIEDVSFGFAIAFLLLGKPMLRRMGRESRLTSAAHLSIAWLLAARWPQDNSYRITSPEAWGAQTALVYGFNVSLMLAAALVVWFLAAKPRPGG